MTNKDDSFEKIINIWEQGQDAFFKAQGEAMESFSRSFKEATGHKAPENMDEALAAWNGFIKSWAPDWDVNSMAAKAGEVAEDFHKSGNAFLAMLEPANWSRYAPEQLRVILQSIADGPKFADLATPQQEAAGAWRETLDYAEAATAMSQVMQEAWIKAYDRFSKDYSIEDLQSGDNEAALNAWLKAANEELLDTQHSQPFMDAQRGMIRASTEIKARQRDIAEAWSETYQIPTRTEVDDLSRSVHELRRELRKVKRELASLRENKK